MKILRNIIITAAIVFLLFFCFIEFVVTKYSVTPVYIPKVNETVYLTNTTAGLNTNIVCISNTRWRRSFCKKEYRYISFEEILFYRVSNDTLYILCGLPIEEDIQLSKNITIIQKRYSNLQYHDELIEGYKNLGLEKFPPNKY